ncbi:MAG: hypothetical protein ABFD54_04405 [Armatimonadota bacterium]
MIARVFPRETKLTPTDKYAFIGGPTEWIPSDITEVMISVAFTWDMSRAEQLAKLWGSIAPVKIGGPATGMRGEEFTPGMFLKPGCVITSRGCDNRCPHCSVWAREGNLRELPITDGWNVLDDNLLNCSPDHISDVFSMLRKQKERVVFTGGLEPARLQDWHIDEMAKTRIDRMYFAYDTPDDYEPLVIAGRKLLEAGYTQSHHLYAYVLIGMPGDTFDAAKKRLLQTWDAGFVPYAMLFRDERGFQQPSWEKFQRRWLRPMIIRRCMAGVMR